MKLLLFDQNLSPRMIERIADLYPGSLHVDRVGLGRASDREVWEYARRHDYMISTETDVRRSKHRSNKAARRAP
jgi:predicted nuclease of predicted toxin-antitoxin system